MGLKSKILLILIVQGLATTSITVPSLPRLVHDLPVTDARIRVDHAKELFGSQYSASLVRRAENVTGVEQFILAKTEMHLPSRWRPQAKLIARTIIDEANESGLDPVFLLAMITRESRLNPAARGRHGEIGLMQIKPGTAEWIARKMAMKWRGADSLLDPRENIRLGVAYVAHLRKRYDRHSRYYISAYNLGPGRLQQMVDNNLYPTRYVGAVMAIYREYYRDLIKQSQMQAQAEAVFSVVAAK